MLALVSHGTSDAPLAIHRTFLVPDGRGKAPVSPAKMMLGPCRGGAVRLGEAGEVLMVGEGIRDLPCRHAGYEPAGLGGSFDIRAPRS
jgi:hypothetical protein